MKSNFHHSLLLAAPATKIYEAITTQHGLEHWWTNTCEVGTLIGQHITIRFGDTYKVMKIENLVPTVEVRWHVTDAHLVVPSLTRMNEWIGTNIVFQLKPLPDGTTQLDLQHIGLTPEIECYEICSQGWAQFLNSLKRYVEAGLGSPYIDSNHLR